MARNKTLQDTVDAVLRECKATTASTAGNDFRQNVKERIRSTHEFYVAEFEWPFMKLKKGDAKVTLAAGQRYYDFPTNLDRDQDFQLWYQHSNIWIPLKEGISPQDYNAWDSDDDQRAEPALKWAYYDETQFEVWPLPATDGKLIWASGRKAADVLVQDTDRLDLDDRIIVLHVAADMMDGKNQKLADKKRADAERRYWQMRANTNVELDVRVGLGGEGDWPPPMTESGWPRTIAVYNPTTP